MNLSLSTIHEAQKQLSRYLAQTRLVAAPSLSRASKSKCLLETGNRTSYRVVQGARRAVFASSQSGAKENPRGGCVKHRKSRSSGRLRGKTTQDSRGDFPAENPNPVKRKRIADLGAKIVEQGQDISDAFDGAVTYAQAEGVFLLNDATDPDLPAGPATIALEILEQLPETSQIYVPMGDTALIRGIGAAAKQISPGIRIVGVQAERAPSYFLSWKQDRVVTTESCNTIADGLATRTPVMENVKAIRELVDDVQLVSEEAMLDAVRHLLLEEHVVAEPSGAATAAAIS